MTQDTLDGKFEKRRRGIFGPPAGKFQAIHVDDLNMPKRETYGAQPPIEILRQWFSQGGWFDRGNDLAFRKIIDIVFIASLGPPGGGRQDMTARFVRPFNVVGADSASFSLNFSTSTSRRRRQRDAASPRRRRCGSESVYASCERAAAVS